MRNLTVWLVFSLPLVVGCAGETPQAPPPGPPVSEPEPVDERPSFGTDVPEGTWRLVAFGDATEVSDAEVTFRVTSDGTVAGSAGCNNYFGQWTIEEGRARVGPLGGTKRMCPPEIMAVEGRFLEELERTAGWRHHVDGLVLVDEGGEPLLVLDPAVRPSE